MSSNAPSRPTVKQVSELTEEQLKSCVQLASDAFGTNGAIYRILLVNYSHSEHVNLQNIDPSMSGTLGGDMSLKDELLTAMFRATLLEGRVYMVETEGEVATICLLFRKPNSLFATETQRDLGFTEFFSKLSPETQNWWTHDYPAQMAEKEREIISQEEWDKMWYFSLVVTAPKYQGQGFASFFMDKFAEETQNRGEVLGLSTGLEVNVQKYESMKFRERGRITMKTVVNLFPCVWLTRG
ncbi:hypothetical protein BDW22DRAFT_1424186 [Trametopsis cervina]|nr:hypothetical protein BDW22DRAFT_1424186 [Trametopsis cervina]